MMKKAINKEVKVVSVYLIANIINKAIAFLTIPIFSRLLSTSEYGMVSTYVSIVSIMQYIMGLSSEYTVRNAYVDYKNEIPKYMSSMFLLTAIWSSVVFALIICTEHIMGISESELIIFGGCIVIHSYATYINNAVSNKLMMDESYIKRAVMLSGPNLVSAVLGLVFIIGFNDDRVYGRILGYVIGVALFGIYNLLYTWKSAKPRVIFEYWSYILKISLPLVVHGLSMTALAQIDRIMITSMKSSSETGVYSIIYSLSMVASAITTAIDGIWSPWFTEQYVKRNYNVINEKSKRYLMLVLIIMIEIMLVSPEVLKVMTPSEYWYGIVLIPPLVMASFFTYMYSFFLNVELMEKKTKMIAVFTMISALSNIALNYVSIPRYGALAASVTTLASYILLFVLHCLYSKYINREVYRLSYFFKPMLAIGLTVIVFYRAVDLIIARWGMAVFIGILFGYNIKSKTNLCN